jgi:hypothetical protein
MQLFDLNVRIQQLTWSLICYEKYSTSLSTIVLVVLTIANFGGFSNFCRYYTRSQAGKSTWYRPTLKPLKILILFGFPIFWLWAYLIKVITETCDEYTKLDVYIFITKLLKLPTLCLYVYFEWLKFFYGPVNFEIVRFNCLFMSRWEEPVLRQENWIWKF